MKIKDTGSEIQIYDFTAVEAYRIARKIEREGMRFYQQLMEKTADAGVKELLTYLCAAEEEHLQLFEHLLEAAEREAGRGGDEEDDLIDSVDDTVFSVSAPGLYAADFEHALQLGIIIEKRSLAFYLEVEKNTENSEAKTTLRKIIAEERKHWEQLKALAR